MPFYKLAIPFALLLVFSVYMALEVDTRWALACVGLIVVLLGGYILSPLINWWWWEKNPPDIAKELHGLLENKFKFYQDLNEEGRREFRRRIFLFSHGTNFMSKALEKVTDDVKLMIGAIPVRMTFHQETFLFENFENVVVYPFPFPSPQFPDKFHASEIYEEDGVIMFSLEQAVRGFVESDKYFSPAWYEYAKIYQKTYPNLNYGDWSKISWPRIEQVCGYSRNRLERYIGLPDLDIKAFGIACYFLYPEQFEKYLPELNTKLNLIFNTK